MLSPAAQVHPNVSRGPATYSILPGGPVARPARPRHHAVYAPPAASSLAASAAAPDSSIMGGLAAETLAESVERVVVSPVFRTGPWDAERLAQQRAVHQAHILLVSESDVCRSVLAAAALRRLLQEAGLGEAVVVDTCGTRPYNLGEEPEPSALAAAEALGLLEPLDASSFATSTTLAAAGSSSSSSSGGDGAQPHRARLFSAAEDMVGADLVLVMDKYTAGDVMREVSSFDLVNRSQPLTYKVRRLGEFCDWAPPPVQLQPLQSGADGVAAAAAAVAVAATAPPPEYGSEGDELDIEDPLYGNVGGDAEARAVLRTARAILRCCQGLVAFLSHMQQQQQQQQHGGSASTTSPAALGPALRAHLAGMAPAAWLAPPMLSPRVDREQLPAF